ncbi:BrlA [Purpureocillium lavendulum]|uniref:BrlA n=1 Tax=Purpureocillium lavendulum TaxID=1247861 RepID=A0AB34FK44_9HYPO|nr:BrlA [Purpureocillium lavendulum]
MAVISTLPSVSVTVKVDNVEAPEYAPTQDEASGTKIGTITDGGSHSWPRMTTYIESRHKELNVISVRVFIDGKYVQGSSEYLKRARKGRPCTNSIAKTYTQSDKEGHLASRAFTFAPVTSVEDDSKERIAKDAKTVKSLGEIRVLIQLAQLKKSKTKQKRTTSAGSDGVVHEKRDAFILAEKAQKGKAISHGTSFPITGTIPASPRTSTSTAGNVVAIGEYVFQYRSRDALQAEMILPRSPSVSAEVPDVTAMSLTELRSFTQKLLQSQMAAPLPVKREREAEPEEGNGRRYKMVKLDNGKAAVDLTED